MCNGHRNCIFFQSSASECILDSLLAARAQMIQRLKLKYGDDVEETTLLSKMMAYCSKEAHSSVEKAAMISFVKLRILEPDENCSLRGDALRQAMEEDVANGMYPFFVSTTLGTTGCCAFDNIEEIGERSRVLFFSRFFRSYGNRSFSLSTSCRAPSSFFFSCVYVSRRVLEFFI